MIERFHLNEPNQKTLVVCFRHCWLVVFLLLHFEGLLFFLLINRMRETTWHCVCCLKLFAATTTMLSSVQFSYFVVSFAAKWLVEFENYESLIAGAAEFLLAES